MAGPKAGDSLNGPPLGDGRAWFLRRLNLFEGMTDDEIESVGGMLRQRHCESGQQIRDAEGDHLFLLKDGQVRLYRITPDGEEVTTAVIRPGQLFGLGGMIGKAGISQAEALVPSVICDATATHFMGVLARHPLLMARVTMTMARQIFQLEETIERMGMHTASARVAAVVCDLAEEAIAGGGEAVLPYNQTQIAKLAGLTRESVARVISAWREEGVVAAGNPIRVLDHKRIRAMASGDTASDQPS